MHHSHRLLRSAGYCLSAVLLLAAATSGSAFAAPPEAPPGLAKKDPPGIPPGQAKKSILQIEEQGSFAAGGTVLTDEDGDTFHGDHLYAFYQMPPNARQLPLVMLHGAGQFGKTWETTPDGREGYQNIFLRRGFGVYVVDQPRRGRAGRSTLPITINPNPNERGTFNNFRLGLWPDFFPGVQFAQDEETLNQYWRQQTPNTGPGSLDVTVDAFVAMFDKIGPGIMVTHSAGGGPGWYTAMATEKVRAVVAYEVGSNFPFPEGEVPPPIGNLSANAVPLEDFMKLTKIPIIIYYGDNIPELGEGIQTWRIRIMMARLWRDALNARGGDVTVVHLPEIGIFGNTHFPFSDLNNVQIADLMSEWLEEKGLDNK